MATNTSREAGYRILLEEAERDVAAARRGILARNPKAPARLREAESVRDRILRLLGSAPTPSVAFDRITEEDTLANDFGVDDEEAPR